MQLFSALAARYTEPHRDAKYDSARVRIANGAFIPSRVWSDTSVWTASAPTHRELQVRGGLHDGRYVLQASREVPAPEAPAESRHLIMLTRLADGEYAWDTDVPYAIGTVTASQFGAFVGALFASAEQRDEAGVRADFGRAIPRASAVLGQLFRLDSIRTTHFVDGSTLAVFSSTMVPQRMVERYPNLSRYLRRYAQTARVRMSLTDPSGASYLEYTMETGAMHLRVRAREGRMISLMGPPRPMPDSLVLNGELSVKVRGFTVGFRDYHGEFVITRTQHERAWGIASREEPRWELPLFTERLLRSPLRRPFQGRGATFRIGVRDSVGAQTVLARTLHFEVKESAILRFLGRLGSIAVSEFTGRVEKEEAEWLHAFFEALVADVRALTS